MKNLTESPKTVFYSWQSDINKKLNNHFIKDALEKALKKLNKDVSLFLSLDKDTENRPGSPDIVDTIFQKIRSSDIFICDVTIINNGLLERVFKRRKTPNPNVLIELGYAVKTLGWDRIVCIVNTSLCKVEDLPFDIRNNRTSTYYLRDVANKKAAEKGLTDTLAKAIKAILENYEEILETFQKDDTLGHDKLVFQKFDAIANQNRLFESLDFLVNNLMTDASSYRLWTKIDDFYKALENIYLNDEIQGSFKEFALKLEAVHLYAATKLFSENIPGMQYRSDYEDRGVAITSEIQDEIDQTHRHAYPKGPHDNNWQAYHERLDEVQTEFGTKVSAAKESYVNFRLSVKKHLLM